MYEFHKKDIKSMNPCYYSKLSQLYKTIRYNIINDKVEDRVGRMILVHEDFLVSFLS